MPKKTDWAIVAAYAGAALVLAATLVYIGIMIGAGATEAEPR